jgi:methylglyoxal synthase
MLGDAAADRDPRVTISRPLSGRPARPDQSGFAGCDDELGLSVTCFQSGPLGGDQQIGARIAEGEIDLLIFFWDPLEPQPHDPDVKALLRVAVLWNIPVACNRASAAFLISSPLLGQRHQRQPPDHREQADPRPSPPTRCGAGQAA